MGQFSARTLTMGVAVTSVLTFGTGPAIADSPPRIDHAYPTLQPAYPDSAQLSGEQGDVLVGVHVSSSGRPRRLRIDKSSGFPDLDNAAAEAVAQWHFVPAVENGDTTSAWTSVRIHFELPLPMQPVYATPPGQKN